MLFINRKRMERHINSNCTSCLEEIKEMNEKNIIDKQKNIILALY